MILSDLTLPTLAENLALDEAWLIETHAGRRGELLRFWEWSAHAVVLGISGSVTIDVDAEACSADGVPIVRRSSGGGTVVLGPGCLMYSLILDTRTRPELRGIRGSYATILGRLTVALDLIAPGCRLEGISDLADASGRKFSGNAQQRKSEAILHHGTLLYAFDLERVGRYLRWPERTPDYRGTREHGEFVTNLAAGRDELTRRVAEAFEAEPGEIDPLPELGELIAERHGNREWHYRR